jgi:membrane associated rhomboid family serine protease
MTWGIVGANALVFFLELRLPREALQGLFFHFGTVPARYLGGPEGGGGGHYWSFVTGMFLHAGWLHVITNMWALWIFGDNVEDRMGPVRFLVFYLLCGVLAAVAHTVTNPGSTVPAVGASGAIAGVMGAYLLLYPLARVVTLIPVFFWPIFIEIPAFVYLGIWFFTQFYSGSLALGSPEAAGGIAWWAHVGGFVAGLVLLVGFLRRNRGAPRRPGG